MSSQQELYNEEVRLQEEGETANLMHVATKECRKLSVFIAQSITEHGQACQGHLYLVRE